MHVVGRTRLIFVRFDA
jgi:hypothetical protein